MIVPSMMTIHLIYAKKFLSKPTRFDPQGIINVFMKLNGNPSVFKISKSRPKR